MSDDSYTFLTTSYKICPEAVHNVGLAGYIGAFAGCIDVLVERIHGVLLLEYAGE